MQSAGRILLMPKGDYSASVTYEMLDLVNHNGASWVCKKDCTGQEPSGSNTEFWQWFGADNAKTLDGHGADYFFPKTGGNINGHLRVKIPTAETIVSVVANSKREVYQEISPDGTYRFYDGTNKNSVFSSTPSGESTFNGTASGNLPISGGGTVSSNNDTPITLRSNTSKNVYQRFVNSEGVGWYFGFDENGARVVGQGYLLHTGNKPTGTYTGNGSATSRTISTGGIGEVAHISCGTNSFATLSASGYIGFNGTSVVCGTDAYFVSGKIIMSTTSALFNANGTTYTYQLL